MATPLGSTPGIIIGVGVGTATAAALEPVIELPKQAAWSGNANRVLDVTMLARLVAQGGLAKSEAVAEAMRSGYAGDKLDGLIYLSQTVPPVAQALTLWRRDLITDELWSHSLAHQGLDTRYLPGLNALKVSEPLSPADLAYAVVRGLVPDEGILPVAPPAAGVKIKRFPVFPLNPVEEAARSGMNRERFSVLVGRSGLAMAPVMAANAYFRNIIERQDYDLAIAEGDLRNEFRDAILDVSRQILTAHDYAELQLRGYLSRPERLVGTDRHGMSHADSDLLYDVLGRAPSVHQVLIGLARGAKYPAVYGDVPEPYRAAIQRSNIREPWVDIAYHARYGYPSGFQIRSEAQKGDLTEAETKQILLEVGWSPKWAAFFAEKWTGATGPVADPHVGKAQTQLWNTTHRSYIAEEVGDAAASERFALLAIPAAAQTAILDLWRSERALVRSQLSLPQLKKAYTGKVTNPATGQPWSAADVTTALLDRGYSQADASTILAEW